jgi:hypothetical protein
MVSPRRTPPSDQTSPELSESAVKRFGYLRYEFGPPLDLHDLRPVEETDEDTGVLPSPDLSPRDEGSLSPPLGKPASRRIRDSVRSASFPAVRIDVEELTRQMSDPGSMRRLQQLQAVWRCAHARRCLKENGTGLCFLFLVDSLSDGFGDRCSEIGTSARIGSTRVDRDGRAICGPVVAAARRT